MRGLLLSIGSIVLTSLVIGNAFYQKGQFYPSVVYITKSNPSLAVLYLQAFVFVLLLGQLSRKVFFGQLRPAETEHLIERSWYAVTETCLAFTVFRDNFSPLFVAQFTMLLFLKCFHWLSEDRIEYMERSPMISFLFHIRVICLLTLLGTLDSLFVHKAYNSVLNSGASTQLVFGFEYAILLTIVVAVFMKYVLHTIDLQSVNPWENKAVYILYSELVMGFIKSSLYVSFMFIMIRVHTFPLFAIRPMYLTLRSFKKSISDVIMSRRAILNMNTLYPDATEEELASGDNVCIICREEMTTNAKKLPCNHIFHISCLRSWFQRQQTCPTCRLDVLGQPQHARPAAQGPPAPQQGIPPHAAHMPPPFPMFPMGFPPGAPPGVQPGPPPPQPPTTQGTSPPSTSSQPSSMPMPGTLPPFPPPPFPMFPPPMFGFPFPQASSNGDTSSLTMEELRAMEGEERESVEARIRVLRNIHSLLDTAITQLNQYTQAVTSTRTPTFGVGFPSSASASTAPVTTTTTRDQNSAENIVSSSTADVPGPSWAVLDENAATANGEARDIPEGRNFTDNTDNANSSHNDLRQRRIERFSSQPNEDQE
ncbi:E3 ubiquitin-protein ligase synoviolin-like [Dendronephthya gigantea]|uniref:E3 ubiquitin-protein ligase synoviolin-like n=1 Tax=Dendronephthya gigantea TaxID=151771 RepID=UPI001069E8D2|nr:E3 ubiquitin-protein ligase synoviolin-like [Dendronephthya gigantea]